jgi:hypothetical protein
VGIKFFNFNADDLHFFRGCFYRGCGCFLP